MDYVPRKPVTRLVTLLDWLPHRPPFTQPFPGGAEEGARVRSRGADEEGGEG